MMLRNVISSFRSLFILFLFVVDIALSVVVYFDFSTYNIIYWTLEISITVILIWFSFFIAKDIKSYEKIEVVMQLIKKYNSDIVLLIKEDKVIYPISKMDNIRGLNKNIDSLEKFFGEEWEHIKQSIDNGYNNEVYGDFSYSNKHYSYKLQNISKNLKKRYRAIIFIQDVTRLKLMKFELHRLLAKYRVMSYELDSMVNSLPVPLWKRNADGMILYSNDAYNKMVKDAGYDINSEHEIYDVNHLNLEMGEMTIKKVFIHNNKPEYYQFIELPLIEEQKVKVGVAHNISELELLHKNSAINFNTLQNLIDCSEDGILVINLAGNVAFFNQALCKLFLLDESWLYQKPSYASLLDKMNEKGVLPSMKDYKKFKQQQLQYLQEHSEKDVMFLYLNNGDSIQITISPVQGGDTLFIYKNISKDLLLERMNNERYNTINILLNLMDTAVMIFDDGGKIININDKCLQIFNIPPVASANVDNLNNFTRYLQSVLKSEELQQALNLISNSIEHRHSDMITLTNISLRTIILPNKLVAAIFNEVYREFN